MNNTRFSPFFLILIFVFCSFAGNVYAMAERCPRHDIKTSMKNKLYKTKSFRGTTKGFTQYTQGHSRSDSKTLGFVEYKGLTTKFNTKYEVIKVGNDKYCIKMTKVRGYFNVRPKLFMPIDYKKNSCEYKQILKHEKRHLKALKDFHNSYSKRFNAHLGRLARTVPVLKPVSKAEIGEVTAYLDNYFISGFKNFEYEAWMSLLKKQAKIDSPQEYLGVAKRCNNW